MHRASRITHHASRIAHRASRITHHASRITHHASRITHHASRIAHHTSGRLHICIAWGPVVPQFLRMRLVRAVKDMQRLAARWQRSGKPVGLVPTMGYLHEGHLSLVRRARRSVGRTGLVVLSIYVNPKQFGPKEDFSRYPRDLTRDLDLCRRAGVDIVFAPADADMYPAKGSSTFVVEEQLSQTMEGASRPTHFRGVTTVVAKLFNLVLPRVAVFGAKDYQQAALIKRMAQDLNFPVRVDVAPTCREPDGLAMSSRNEFLKGPLRKQGTVLWQALQRARSRIRKSQRPVSVRSLKSELKRFIERAPSARLDYVEFFHPETLVPVPVAGRGTHMALAVFVGTTRLIDNARL